MVFYQGLPETHPSGAARLRVLETFNETVGPDQGIVVDLSNSVAAAPGAGGNNVAKIKTMVAAGTPPELQALHRICMSSPTARARSFTSPA